MRLFVSTVVFSLILAAGATGQESYRWAYEGELTFTGVEATFSSFGGSAFSGSKDHYQFQVLDGESYLSSEDERLLVLKSEQIVFVLGPKDSVFIGVRVSGEISQSDIVPGKVFMSTSQLSESGTTYFPGNLRTLTPDHPWVEGEYGDGSGTELKVAWDTPITKLLVVNGFISCSMPVLFSLNNRLKEALARDTSGRLFTIKLEDTNRPQIIDLPRPTSGIELQIVETFPGSKYDDTCISLIAGIR